MCSCWYACFSVGVCLRVCEYDSKGMGRGEGHIWGKSYFWRLRPAGERDPSLEIRKDSWVKRSKQSPWFCHRAKT